MMMKVLAARLPADEYIAVLVALRDVGANAPVMDQVQQALDGATNRRVSWHELVEAGADCLRIVIFDGFDELLQATNEDRTGYLEAAAQFQRVELEQNRPTVAIVTSRTVVADRVDIHRGTAVVKLEGFESEQVRRWLDVWNDCNAVPIATDRVRRVDLDAVMGHIELASQPLLLLLLALYSADPNTPPLSSGTCLRQAYIRT